MAEKKWHVRDVSTGEVVKTGLTRPEAMEAARQSGAFRLFPGARPPKDDATDSVDSQQTGA